MEFDVSVWSVTGEEDELILSLWQFWTGKSWTWLI